MYRSRGRALLLVLLVILSLWILAATNFNIIIHYYENLTYYFIYYANLFVRSMIILKLYTNGINYYKKKSAATLLESRCSKLPTLTLTPIWIQGA